MEKEKNDIIIVKNEKKMNKYNKYIGKWRITEMEQWDQDFVDLVVPGYFKFDSSGKGDFKFGAIAGDISYMINVNNILEFSWNGSDEMDEASGYGYCELKNDKEIEGKIIFIDSDDSFFKAIKKQIKFHNL